MREKYRSLKAIAIVCVKDDDDDDKKQCCIRLLGESNMVIYIEVLDTL